MVIHFAHTWIKLREILKNIYVPCDQSSCGHFLGYPNAPIGAAYYNLESQQLWENITGELKEYGPILSSAPASHVSFEYFCCMEESLLLAADKFINDHYQWKKIEVQYATKLITWNNEEEYKFESGIALRLNDDSQIKLFNEAHKFENKLKLLTTTAITIYSKSTISYNIDKMVYQISN